MPAPRAAGEMKKGGAGAPPPLFLSAVQRLPRPSQRKLANGWLHGWFRQMVSLCATMVLFKSEKQREVKLEGGIRERKVLESKGQPACDTRGEKQRTLWIQLSLHGIDTHGTLDS